MRKPCAFVDDRAHSAAQKDEAAAAAPGGQLCCVCLEGGGGAVGVLVDTWASLLIPHASLKAARSLSCSPLACMYAVYPFQCSVYVCAC